MSESAEKPKVKKVKRQAAEDYKNSREYQKRKYKKKQEHYAPRRKAGIISEAGASLGGALGGMLGPAGSLTGNFLGGKLGHLIEQITGFGDYAIKNNTIMNGGMTPPQVVNSMNQGGYIVRHREYICDINPSIGFGIQTFPLNPGLQSCFPWLSQVASSFDEYRWRGLLFEFKSMSSDAVLSSASSSALGSVIMATQYNSLAAPFVDKRTMENYEFANSEKPSCTFIHPVECKSSVTPVSILYVRTGDNFVGDQRLYDLGEFNIATVGMQSGSGVVGELWCTYEIEFFKNRYSPQYLSDRFQLNGTASPIPFGTSVLKDSGSNLGGRIDLATRRYYFPPNMSEGIYTFEISWTGDTGSANFVSPTTTLFNVSAKVWYFNNTTANAGSAGSGQPMGALPARGSIISIYQVTGQQAYIELSNAGVLPASPNNFGQLTVTRLSNSLTGQFVAQ